MTTVRSGSLHRLLNAERAARTGPASVEQPIPSSTLRSRWPPRRNHILISMAVDFMAGTSTNAALATGAKARCYLYWSACNSAVVDAGMITPHAERCPYQFPKWVGCALANHESLSGKFDCRCWRLFAAFVAWQAVMRQIIHKELARNDRRPIVHGGPGGRKKYPMIDTKTLELSLRDRIPVRLLHSRKRFIGECAQRPNGRPSA